MKCKLITAGLDGAIFDVIDALLEEGQPPCMARLIGEGTRARLMSPIPYSTMPAWPSFMTEMSYGRHEDRAEIEERLRALGHP
jgi:predicted AlkP superfamily phosphohydrolase/phosphomutase